MFILTGLIITGIAWMMSKFSSVNKPKDQD